MKYTRIFAVVIGVAALASLLGCGDPAIGKLQTIQLSVGGTGGTVEVKGAGGTLQLAAIGTYTSNSTVDLTGKVVYNVTPNGTDLNGFALPATSATNPQTLTVSTTGLVTAVTPFVCTFTDTAPAGSTSPAYALTGSYQITATMGGITSQPMFVAVASAVGDGPSGACGP